MSTLTVLITGGIGSGKSAVSRYLASSGVPVYDSDSRTKALYEGTLGTVLEREMGAVLHDAEGRFDRKALAALIFTDKARLEQVESIVHPAVLDDFVRWRDGVSSGMVWKGYAGMPPFVCMESAIALEKPLFDGLFDAVVMVDADEEVRIRRACARDSAPEAAVRRRIMNQHPDRSGADYIVENNGGMDDLTGSVDRVFRKLAMKYVKTEY